MPNYRSPAKVNLGLNIVGRRSNGYHELQSIFWPLDFGDDVFVSPSEETTLTCRWNEECPRIEEGLPSGTDNLAFQAASGLPVNIEITKRIPMGAGLGGGSSNAATIIKHVSHLSQQNAAALGADVPFFLNAVPSWVTGVGENIEPLNLSAADTNQLVFYLVFPPFGCATDHVFQAYRKSGVDYSPRQSKPRDWVALKKFLSTAQNDFEPVLIKQHPTLQGILSTLRQLPALYAGITGSGSTLVAVFDKCDQKNIKQELKSFRITDCKSVIANTF